MPKIALKKVIRGDFCADDPVMRSTFVHVTEATNQTLFLTVSRHLGEC